MLHNSATEPEVVEPSASTIAMMSPVAASNPQARALPLPERFCLTMADLVVNSLCALAGRA